MEQSNLEKMNQNQKKKKPWKRFVAFIAIFFLLFIGISNMMEVNDYTSLANIKGFYLEPKNSIDVALIGPSEFYADYSATQAWKEYGYTSYSLAVAGIPGNMYKSMLKEVQKRQSPKLVVFELNGFMQDDDYFQRQGQLHTWIDNMPWSENKIETIQEMIPKDEQYSYYCKLATYHNNWKDLAGCGSCLAVRSHLFFNGYSYTKGFGTFTKCSDPADSSKKKNVKFTTLSQNYLSDLLSYCKESGMENVLFVRFPHGKAIKNPDVMNEMRDMIESYGYDYLNLNDDYADTGIEPGKDFYNAEHLNVNGMQKMTSYFGKYICDNYAVQGDHTKDQVAYWNDCASKTQDVIAQCETDISQGVVRRYNELSVYWKPRRIVGEHI